MVFQWNKSIRNKIKHHGNSSLMAALKDFPTLRGSEMEFVPTGTVSLERVWVLRSESVGEGEVQFPLVPSLLVRVPLDWNAQTFQGSLLTRQQRFETPAVPCWMVLICLLICYPFFFVLYAFYVQVQLFGHSHSKFCLVVRTLTPALMCASDRFL